MGIQIDVLIYEPTSLQNKVNEIVNIDPHPTWIPRYPDFWVMETWFNYNETYRVLITPPEGYTFHHAEVSGTIMNNIHTNPFLLMVDDTMHGQALRIYLSTGTVPPSSTSAAIDWSSLTVRDMVDSDSVVYGDRLLANEASFEAGQDRTVRFELAFRNVSPDTQTKGFKFALKAISDEGVPSDTIYDPVGSWSQTAYNVLRTLNHEIQILEYGATVRMWLESETGKVMEPFTVYVDSGVEYPHPPGWFDDDDGDNMFWVYALIVLIIMISVFGVSKYQKWI